MALQQTAIKLMELADAKVSKMTADTGSAPTYASSVDVGGVVKIGVAPKVETKELKGDSKLLDTYTRTIQIDLDVEAALMSFDALAVLLGGSTSATGSTPNQVTTYKLLATNATPPFFKLEGQWLYAGEGLADAHIILYKCKVTDPPSFEINDASGAFGGVKFKAVALPVSASSGSWMDIVLNETKADIS